MPEDSPPRRTLLTQREAADFLAVTPRTIRNLAAAGHLVKVVIGQRSTRYRLADLEAFVRACALGGSGEEDNQ